MKVCIVGAGAIGGLISTRLAAHTSAQVSALARGRTLQALQTRGWRLQTGPTAADSASASSSAVETALLTAPATARGDAAELGPQDLVILAVKAPALPEVARGLKPLIAAHTVLLPAMNGVPWWFCEGLAEFSGQRLMSIDPQGVIEAHLPLSQVLGCVVHAAAGSPEPGLVHHRMGQGLIVGEPRGGASPRAKAVVDLLLQADFEASLSENIRQDIWFKLWGNMTMNPVSALTGCTVDRILADPLVRELCSSAMREAAAIGRRIGCPIDQSPDDRHAVTARLGAIPTSMLQDVLAGRSIELDALVGAVHEIGLRLGEPMPSIGAILGLTRLFARQRGLYPAA